MLPLNGRGVMVLRPEDGTLHLQAPEGEGNALPGTVVYSEFLGSRWRHVVSVADGVMVQLLTTQRAPSTQVWVRYPRSAALC